MPADPGAPPFHVLRLDHVVLRVADTGRAIAFYAQALGCTLVRRRDDLGLVHLRAGTSMIDLVAVDGPLGRKGGAGAGAEGDGPSLYFRDPDGDTIERKGASTP